MPKATKKTNDLNLTPKQEKFAQLYVRYGDKSKAYRESYDAKNMKPESINTKASVISNEVKIRSRIEQLQNKLQEKYKMDLERTIYKISQIANFDIGELYDENDNLINIQDIPKDVRVAISSLKVTEEFQGFGKDKETTGFTKEVRVINKLDALEKLVKIFGGYKEDNEQKQSPIQKVEVEFKDFE